MWNFEDFYCIPKEILEALQHVELFNGKDIRPIAYLGNKEDGNNKKHCVLCDILTNDDNINVAIVTTGQKNDDDYSVINVEEILEGGEEFGSFIADVHRWPEAPKFVELLFTQHVPDGFVEEIIQPVAFLGTKHVRGTEFYYLCATKPSIDNDTNTGKIEMFIISDINGELVERKVVVE